MSKLVGNTACILAYLFNSASRQHCEIWALHFPFLHSFKNTVPPSETCLYGHINWSLAQAQQQSPLGTPQSLTSMRGDKVRPKVEFWFNVQKCMCHILVVSSWPKNLTVRLELRVSKIEESPLQVHLLVLWTSGRRGQHS